MSFSWISKLNAWQVTYRYATGACKEQESQLPVTQRSANQGLDFSIYSLEGRGGRREREEQKKKGYVCVSERTRES